MPGNRDVGYGRVFVSAYEDRLRSLPLSDTNRHRQALEHALDVADRWNVQGDSAEDAAAPTDPQPGGACGDVDARSESSRQAPGVEHRACESGPVQGA